MSKGFCRQLALQGGQALLLLQASINLSILQDWHCLLLVRANKRAAVQLHMQSCL
jgi:hypothetical protein